jgi:hypothetical protein
MYIKPVMLRRLIQRAEPLVLEPSAFEVEMAIENLEGYESRVIIKIQQI